MVHHSEIGRTVNRRTVPKFYMHVLIFFIFLFGTLSAQEMRISGVDLYLENDVLFTRLHIIHFFNQDVKDNIASGMSRRLTAKFELIGNADKSLFDTVIDMILKYDIWERKYIITIAGDEKQFDDFDHFMQFFTDSTTFRLNSVTRIDPDQRMQLYIVFSHQEISERQQRELKLWISRDAETAETQPGPETNQSFSINISRLLSLFFSREQSTDLYIYKSPFFTVKKLYQDENTAK